MDNSEKPPSQYSVCTRKQNFYFISFRLATQQFGIMWFPQVLIDRNQIGLFSKLIFSKLLWDYKKESSII